MAALYDFRDAVQEVLEWALRTPCTCWEPDVPVDARRHCLAHRAHYVLGGLYWYGTPTMRFSWPMQPKYLPLHRISVAHDWERMKDRYGFPTQEHRPGRCRAWCRDCGARFPGACPGDQYRGGENVGWYGDYIVRHPSAKDQPKSCLWVIERHWEMRPDAEPAARPVDLRKAGEDLPRADGGLPPGLNRRSG